ncbi:hypothetical protein TWF225_004760 [Orbilia oligospora]|nr:hypothetical protein TWF225_004760 [Orbilia oligospora]
MKAGNGEVVSSTFNNESNKVFLQTGVNHGNIPVLQNTDKSEGVPIVLQAGINNGHVFNILPRKAETKIKKINYKIPMNLPFPRNCNFSGREAELTTIDQCFDRCFDKSGCDNAAVVCALTGTGGMGKTQIAVEYAYASREIRGLTAVFWVSAATEETIRTSFVNIMQRIVEAQAKASWPESNPDYIAIGICLGIPGLVDREGKVSFDAKSIDTIVSALFSWLALVGNCQWLLIFDNADELNFPIDKYFPKNGGGAVLVTSRRQEFLHCAKQINLKGLDKENAVGLLLNLAGLPNLIGADNRKHAIAVVEKLGFMPLAISHAGCFIHEMNIPVKEYLRYYDETFKQAQSRVPKIGWVYRNDTATTTWEISFLEVQRRNGSAAILLLACSYLDSSEISEALWESEWSDMEFITQQKRRFSILASYSLINRNPGGTFSIHPVVHDWARERVNGPDRMEAVGDAVKAIRQALRRKEVSQSNKKWDGGEERKIMAHAEVLYKYLESIFDELLEHEQGANAEFILDTLDKIATIFWHQGRYDEAIKQYQRVLTAKERFLGMENLSTLTTAHNIGSVFGSQGKYREALEQYQKVLASKQALIKEQFGYDSSTEQGDHPLTLETINNIAGAMYELGQLKEALQQYQRALAGKEKYLGPDHPSTLQALGGIALTLEGQGKYNEAIKYYQRVLAGNEMLLGEDHPATLTTAHNIASAFDKQFKYLEALKYYQKALAGKERAWGEDHPSTLATMHNMALAYDNKGDYKESLQWYYKALAGREKILGKTHPDTIITIGNIASVFKHQGMYDEAFEQYNRALVATENALGPNHPWTLNAIHNIASVLHSQHKYNESFQQYQKALVGKERVMGEYDPSTLSTIHNIGSLFHSQRRYTEALQWYTRALAGRETLGHDHPATLNTVGDIAFMFAEQGKYSESIEWYTRLLAGREKTLGPEHRLTVSAAQDLAFVSRKRNKFHQFRDQITTFSKDFSRDLFR